uniref:Kelch-like protein 12 n=1 Tax=Phallusia mammillata TaxID=59560 RepID=A0A6F9DGP9_9ASCI|nr:kelch-like protein 12 [Phallusia mammillata]
MDLIAQVDFTSMSSGFLAKVSKENLVRNNGECLRLLVDAVVKVNEPTSTGGKFMLVGGRNSPTDCVIYDVNTRKLTHLPKPNTKRIGSTSVKVRTKVYVSGGVDLEAGQSCEMLDLDQQIRWNMLPNLLESHKNGGSCFVAGHIIVTGGWNCNHGILPSCEKFGFHNNTWVGISNMLHARADHGTAVCNDLLYCIGGYDENEVLSSCERYNMRSGNWNEIAPLSQARQDLTCVVSNGNIYAIGGLGVNNECLSTVERFIPRFGKWQNMASLTVARCHASACVIENKIFVIGGFDGEKDIKSIEVYYPVLNVWTIDFELKKPVREATVVAM